MALILKGLPAGRRRSQRNNIRFHQIFDFFARP
jgi:hypothetical protein